MPQDAVPLDVIKNLFLFVFTALPECLALFTFYIDISCKLFVVILDSRAAKNR